MNPPYGSRNRMPNSVKQYIDSNYQYPAEYYINFVEVCDRMSKREWAHRDVGPRSFMFKDRAGTFRTDFLGGLGSFDFLAEFGYGVLDNAMVGTAGTVIGQERTRIRGEFIRLHDLDAAAKESAFIRVLTNTHDGVKRRYTVNLSDFSKVPGNTICYSIPDEVRDLHDTLKS